MTSILTAQTLITPHSQSVQSTDADLVPTATSAIDMTATDPDSEISINTTVLLQQAQKNPGAFALQISEITHKTQRQLTALTEQLQKHAGNIPGDLPDVTDSFEGILTHANAIHVNEGNGILGKYAQYMKDLSGLMVSINSLVGQEGDKPRLHTKDMLNALEEFRNQYSGEKGIIKSFSKRADADEFMKRFHGDTVLLESKDNHYNVKFNTLAVAPIIYALCDDKTKADQIMTLIKHGWPLNAHAIIYPRTRPEITNSAVVQGLSLATSDIQKTFQTDLDLQINGLGRSISQYDNLVKLFSSMMSSLEASYKSYLQ